MQIGRLHPYNLNLTAFGVTGRNSYYPNIQYNGFALQASTFWRFFTFDYEQVYSEKYASSSINFLVSPLHILEGLLLLSAAGGNVWIFVLGINEYIEFKIGVGVNYFHDDYNTTSHNTAYFPMEGVIGIPIGEHGFSIRFAVMYSDVKYSSLNYRLGICQSL